METEARYSGYFVRWNQFEEEYEFYYDLPDSVDNSWNTLDDIQGWLDELKAQGHNHDDFIVYDNWGDEKTLVVDHVLDRSGFFAMDEHRYSAPGRIAV
jgi:hypothetical protein